MSSERPYPAVDIIEFFQTRSALVVAAVAALDAMPAALDQLKAVVANPEAPPLVDRLQALVALVEGAAIGPDNLLVADPATAHEPFVMCSVNRQPSGAVDIGTIELDRDTLALAGAKDDGTLRPLTALASEISTLAAAQGARDDLQIAIEAVAAQARISISRLSIVKARVDLQRSFLASVMEAESAPPQIRLESHLNQAGARDMALEARRLLSGRSLNIASGNRKTLASLFESHAAQETI